MVCITTRDQISISFSAWGVSWISSLGSHLNYQLYLSHSCVVKSHVVGRWVSLHCLKLHYSSDLTYISISPVFPRRAKEVTYVETCSQLHQSVVFCNMESWLEYLPGKQSAYTPEDCPYVSHVLKGCPNPSHAVLRPLPSFWLNWATVLLEMQLSMGKKERQARGNLLVAELCR